MTAVTLAAMLEQQQQQERQNIEPPLDKVGIADGAHVAGEGDVIGLDDAKESCLQGQLECITHKVDDMLHAQGGGQFASGRDLRAHGGSAAGR